MESRVDDAREPVGAKGPRYALLAIGALCALLLVIAGVVSLLSKGSAAQSPPRNSLVGTHVPVFSVPGVHGGTVSAPWRSGHAAVLLFFASYCAPCHAELPKLKGAVGTGTLGAVRVVGLDGDQGNGNAARFAVAEGLRFPVGHDVNLGVASELVPEGYPAAVFVRANGTVAAVHYGSLSPAQFRSGVSELR